MRQYFSFKNVQKVSGSPHLTVLQGRLEEDYDNSKDWLNNWYEEYTKGIILRSKSDWYELGEKSTKYFLNLERKNSVRNTIRNIFIGDTESSNNEAILGHARSFYGALFSKKCDKTLEQCHAFLNNITTSFLFTAHKNLCDSPLSADELTDSLDTMPQGKSPGNEGLTIEFYKFFWSDQGDSLQFGIVLQISWLSFIFSKTSYD